MATLSAREAAFQKLHDRIITMELKPGDSLNDRLLAEEMGISRTPVREALIMLNIAHMVSIKPQSGTHVAPIDLKGMELEQFARYTLEKEMMLRACVQMRPEHLAAYRENIEKYRVCEQTMTGAERNYRLLELDNRFHRKAFEINGMEEHFDHMLSTFHHIERLRMFSLMIDENKSVCEEHTRIVEALVAQDTAGVARALEAHLQRYKASVAQARQTNPDYFVEG
ncbi:MAG: GntR family transcriptional regulator [Candidatus Faecalibacterium intestinavium]|uniref:GntR family transcriptional regulator n=1 Tax=Candidatus Faecalibacterium intestinavium TaxID=2838580 RepID=A0A9E2KIX2_9FIRM|nr:GntR family transcriptional regulator [Candidatus Faecalibacterium intestinavium]